jgi:hypothetical protein
LKVYKKDALCPFCRRPFNLPLPGPNEDIAKLVAEINAELNKTAGNNNKDPNAMEVILQDSFFLSLPTDMLCSIMLFLPYSQIGRLAMVSQRLRDVNNDGWMWRVMCLNTYPFVQPEEGNWKKTYVKYVMRGRGWQGGKPGDFKMTAYRGHTSWIEVFSMYKNLIVSGSHDNTLKMWRTAGGGSNAINTFTGHTGSILDVKFNEVHVVSGSVDGTAKVWDAQNTAVLSTLQHPSDVVSVMLDQHNVLTGCTDRRARLFDVRSGNELRNFALGGGGGGGGANPFGLIAPIGHQALRKAAFLSNPHYLMVTDDSTVKVWDIRNNNNNPLHTINSGGHFAQDIGQDTIIACDAAGTIRSVNVATGTINWTTQTNLGAFNDFKADPKHIVAAAGTTLNVYNTATGTLTRSTPSAHSATINSLQFDDKKIVTAAQDMSIKVWDMSDGNSLYALLGGSLQARGNNPPHPQRAGCSQVAFDEGKIVASVNSLLRVYAFGPSL